MTEVEKNRYRMQRHYWTNKEYREKTIVRAKADPRTRVRWVAYARKMREQRKRTIDALKMKPCADCFGWYAPYQMHFDHREPQFKVAGVAQLRQGGRPMSEIFEEIAKCDVVCANCHAERTHQQHLRKEI